jgi:hypothetical protein
MIIKICDVNIDLKELLFSNKLYNIENQELGTYADQLFLCRLPYRFSSNYRNRMKQDIKEIQSTKTDKKIELHRPEELKRGMALEITDIVNPETRRVMLYLGRESQPYGVWTSGNKSHQMFSWKYPGIDPEHFQTTKFYQIPHTTFNRIPRRKLLKDLTPSNPAPHYFPFTKKEAKTIIQMIYEK